MATLAAAPRTIITTTSMESFGYRGMAILPWTKQVLAVLWEQLWLLVKVIYCSFMSVFQMFRFEVHFRITDQMGQHNPAESFLFSSLFDGDNGDEDSKTAAGTLLSSLAAAPDDGVYMGFRGDFNIFVSGGASSHEDKFFAGAFPEDESGEDEVVDSKESEALWESLSTCKDPYNPLFFSACLASNAAKRQERPGDGASSGKIGDDMSGLKMWVSRSDSDSSWSSWTSSDASGGDLEESERLLEFFASPNDPYNPMCFTACTVTKAPTPAAPPSLGRGSEEGESSHASSSEDDEEELWKSLCRKDDPYHPLNFQARLSHLQPALRPQPPGAKKLQPKGRVRRHDDITRVPWKRHHRKHHSAEKHDNAQKKVRFSPVVQVHVMRTWTYARQASRKGPWEEMARDRERFRRRVCETERAVGHCFSPAHRDRLRAYIDARRGG
ncbi:protein phosphatase 1 regulatory subunit 15B [Entelurus aequoreus]|uniref:protein phosphatase 1 regulatory subunit 15B n=1 Tax=Entelurus aequoreus TaxID=161455 RepID=UPI002B1DF686|nr:protein phosphatase 1 regulatory subunit 15B [Entelurus aequoreus]